MNLKDAATALEVSEKTVSRYAAAGRLPQRYVKGKTGRQLDFDADEIARLKEELAMPVERATVVGGQPEQGQTRQETALSVLAPSAPVDSQIGALAQLVRAVMDAGQGQTGKTRQEPEVPINERNFLSVDEGAALLGISKGALEKAIKADEIKVHTGLARGRRLKRADLKKWADKK